MLELRPYQRDALDALYNYFRENSGNPVVIAPTAAGKSLMVAKFVQEILEQWPSQRILILTPMKELLDQNHDKLLSFWPDAPVGIYSAAHKRRDIYEPIIFAGIHSVYKKAMQLGRFDLIIVDEAHLISVKSEGMYRKFIDDTLKINPSLKVIGFTATAFRTSTGDITKGDDALFTDVAYEITINQLLELGYLAPLVTKRMIGEFDSSNLHVRNGEFIQKEVEDLVDHDNLTEAALDEVFEFGKNRKSWIFFCVSVEHAEHVRDALRRRGVSAEMVLGTTPKKERERIIQEAREGRIKALTNVDVLTTGTDIPRLDMLVFFRMTLSPGLYVQILGRLMRISPETGKKNGLVLDFGGNVMRHGPVDTVKAWEPKKHRKNSKTAMKSCPKCLLISPVQTRYCPECGYEYEFNTSAPHDATSYDGAILSSQATSPVLKEYPVRTVEYYVHKKAGKPPSMRVQYLAGLITVVAKEWVHFESQHFAQRQKAARWWEERGLLPVPKTTEEATYRAKQGELREPYMLMCNVAGKYPEILEFKFLGEDHE